MLHFLMSRTRGQYTGLRIVSDDDGRQSKQHLKLVLTHRVNDEGGVYNSSSSSLEPATRKGSRPIFRFREVAIRIHRNAVEELGDLLLLHQLAKRVDVIHHRHSRVINDGNYSRHKQCCVRWAEDEAQKLIGKILELGGLCDRLFEEVSTFRVF
ncbi:hypothetical protein PG993_008043 [Apiospora rasikravindrae]|uniref:Uncharacterized protein n=1 Tax=Apiospora rasikravindrae TaxID=990691 RepID=A0ABR1SZ73_9PEZI